MSMNFRTRCQQSKSQFIELFYGGLLGYCTITSLCVLWRLLGAITSPYNRGKGVLRRATRWQASKHLHPFRPCGANLGAFGAVTSPYNRGKGVVR